MANLNGWKVIGGVAVGVTVALVFGAVGGSLNDWKEQATLVAKMARAEEELVVCKRHSDENSERIACLETDVAIIKETAKDTQTDVKRIDKNVTRLLEKLDVHIKRSERNGRRNDP